MTQDDSQCSGRLKRGFFLARQVTGLRLYKNYENSPGFCSMNGRLCGTYVSAPLESRQASPHGPWRARHPGLSCVRMPPQSEDRRDANRAPIELKVEYKRVNTFFADYTKNISRGGTFISTTRPLSVGTEFLFSLTVPGLGEPLRLRGKVIWTNPVETATVANPPGMGIEFQYTNVEERREKERRVWDLLATELGEHTATRLLGCR